VAAAGRDRRASAAFSSSTARHFRITGPSLRLDSRTEAFRDDLADITLSDQVLAPHYARALLRGCGADSTFVRERPDAGAAALSELLPGEDFAVLEYAGGWAWGHSRQGRLVGYVETIALSDPTAATHIVCEEKAPVTADADVAAPVLASLPMGARLHGAECGPCLTTEYGCVSLSHLRRIDGPEADPVAVAERLFGAPWLEGGRTGDGIDAAGLVQLALALSGMDAPRLADQLGALGVPAGGAPQRGDLVHFDGGVGLMIDDLMFIHASREAGKVTLSPLAEVSARGLALRRLAG